jgi:predicted RNA-binding Zn-ribbon protein involved in translation (DUF1610 family)
MSTREQMEIERLRAEVLGLRDAARLPWKCPNCGSERAPAVRDKESRHFFPSRGCLDCDTWAEPVVCR